MLLGEVDALEEAEAIVLGQGANLIEGLAEFFILAQVVTLLVLIVLVLGSERGFLFGVTRRHRAFRCPLMKREVEVEFEERRCLGVRCSVAVKSCTGFEVATAVGCRRACVDSAFRRQWEFALPVS